MTLENFKLNDFGNVINFHSHGKWIYDSIREGMAPFTLKRIEIWCDFDIDYNEYRVLGAALLLNDYTIEYVVRVNAWDLAEKRDHEMWRVAEEMRESFRNRFDWPVPTNIYLGEN